VWDKPLADDQSAGVGVHPNRAFRTGGDPLHDASQEATIGHVVARALAWVEPLSKQVLDELNYTGWIGCEYRPPAGMKPGGTSAGLGWLKPYL
jgi:hypothetical protein